MSRIVRTACTRHCGDGCSLLVEVGQDGLLAIRGNPDHPFTQGLLCAKTARFGERISSPRRITTPLIREGAEGEAFREASWEEALKLIAGEIQSLHATPERMLHILYHASFGLLHQASKLLFTTLGASGFSGSPCLAAGAEALKRDFGSIRQGPLSEAMTAARIVNWGRNATAQSVHLAAMITKARKHGARVLSIHPGDTGYAGLSDEQIVIRPGTDRFLAAAAAKIILKHGRADRAALDRCFDTGAFLNLLDALALDDLLAACGASLEQARMLADWYVSAAPPGTPDGQTARKASTSTLIGRGLQRYAFGGENVRFIDALAMLSGQVGRAGAGVYFMRQDLGQAAWNWTQAKPGYSRTFPISDIARSVEAADPPVEFVWVEGMNLVTQCPGSLATQRMLTQRFTVVVEPFMTDTARCARVILPPAIMLECEDLVKNDAHRFVNHAAKVLEPRGSALPNFEIAARLGALLSPPVTYPAPEEVMDAALRQGKLGSSLHELRKAGWLGADMPETPWADGVFAHPDGLYRFPAALHADNPGDERYPLRLLSPVRRDHLLSQVPEESQETPPRVYLSPDCPALAELRTVAPRPSSTGPSGPAPQSSEQFLPARLETVLGCMDVRVGVLEGLHPDAVLYPRGDWLAHGGCVNRVIRPCSADMGGQAAYYEERARLVIAPPAQERTTSQLPSRHRIP
jgi:anaerobic selenocysteine-containing dehydrogenase